MNDSNADDDDEDDSDDNDADDDEDGDSDDDICMGVWLREGNRGRADDQLFP